MRKTTNFCQPYGLSSYHDLCRKFVVQAKEELQTHLQVNMVNSFFKFGATLAIGGWSSVTNCPLFNALLISSTKEQFLGLVDTKRY